MAESGTSRIEVSVVITCYNLEHFIGSAIDSVCDQTAAQAIREVVIIDDGSSDGSVAVIRDRIRDLHKCRLIERANSGGAATPRNDGIAATTAPYIAFLDGDDLWGPEKLATEIKALATFPELGLLFSDYVEFDADTGVERRIAAQSYHAGEERQLEKLFVKGGPIIPSGAIVRRTAIDAVGGFDPTMKFNEDPELWLRIATRFTLHHIPAPLWRKRDLSDSLGSLKNGQQNIDFQHEITQRMLEMVPSLAIVVAEREARIAFHTATFHIKVGRKSDARDFLRQTLTYQPRNLKALLYLIILWLPGNPETYIGHGRRLVACVIALVRRLNPGPDPS